MVPCEGLRTDNAYTPLGYYWSLQGIWYNWAGQLMDRKKFPHCWVHVIDAKRIIKKIILLSKSVTLLRNMVYFYHYFPRLREYEINQNTRDI